MTFNQTMETRKKILRKEQNELKKCIDEYFDDKMNDLCKAERIYQMLCKHPFMITTTFSDNGKSCKCPDCGYESARGSYKLTLPPIPYQHKDKVEELFKTINIEEKWKLV